MAGAAALPAVEAAVGGEAAAGGAAGGGLMSRFGMGALKQGAAARIMGGRHSQVGPDGQAVDATQPLPGNPVHSVSSQYSAILQPGQFH